MTYKNMKKDVRMKNKVQDLLDNKNMKFHDFSKNFTISKQTLTKKLNGTLDWTFEEVLILTKVFEIEDPATFFYN